MKNYHKKIKGVSLVTAFLTVPLVASAATAETETLDTFTLPEVVVTATRTDQDVQKIPAAVQVITEKQIKSGGAASVQEVLRQQTDIMTGPHMPAGSELSLRGMNTNQTLVLVNGRRVANEESNSAENSHVLDRINVDNVDRIEVVRGPASALYGTDALGGVINIITKKSTKAGGSVGVYTGRGSAGNWYHLDSGALGKLSATADMRLEQQRKLMNGDAQTYRNYGPSQTYSLSADYDFDQHRKLNFSADFFKQHLVSDNDDSGLQPYTFTMGTLSLPGLYQSAQDKHTWTNYTQTNYGLAYDGQTGKHTTKARIYTSRFGWDDWTSNHVVAEGTSINGAMYNGRYLSAARLNAIYTAALTGQNPDYDFNTNERTLWGAEFRDTYQANAKHRLTLGGEYIYNQVRGTDLNDGGDNITSVTQNGVSKNSSEKSVQTRALYVQDEMDFGKWFVTPALRYDHHSAFGDHYSPKVGVTYSARPDFRIKANYGEGFKAPSIMALYYHLYRLMDVYRTIYGNPNLKPEESKSWDVGFEGEKGKFSYRAAYFDNRVKNLITTTRVEDINWKYINVGQARIKGLETQLGWQATDKWQFKLAGTWLDAHDETSGNWLTNRARFNGVLQVGYDDRRENGISALVTDQFAYRQRVPDSYYTTGTYSTSGKDHTYNLVNMLVTKKFNKNFRVYAGLDNLFDKNDLDAGLYGRMWKTGAVWNF
jgi:outer membrane receptor for ferrienterochelin and colicins